jgi:L-2-hydroxyglutarate oxidase LhgO
MVPKTDLSTRSETMQETDFLIVGAGIVGLSIARELARRYSDCRIVIIEKEKEAAFHASGRNSGVLHAGFYYDADSLKAKFCVAGNKALTDYCLENGLPINRCGKVVVASKPAELEGIHELKRRGDRNGVALDLIDEADLAQIEPNARTCGQALFSPTTATVNPRVVCRHIAAQFPPRVHMRFEHQMVGLEKRTALTSRDKIGFKYLFNAAGLYAVKIARFFNAGRRYKLLPFKGLYLAYDDSNLIQRHIYPVPNLKNPFLGVHFTKTVDHHVKIGPTAIPALWFENYDFRSRFRWDEFASIVGCQAQLFWHNNFNFRSLAWEEVQKYNRKYFIGAARRLVKRFDADRFKAYGLPGIRAQLLDIRRRVLVMDFVVEYGRRSTHVLNSISPAFTTAFAFAEFVVDASAANTI